MGVYDTILVCADFGQVKLWSNRFQAYRVGDRVPDLHGKEVFLDYDIAMREGGYVHVRGGILRGWDAERATEIPCFDKWGNRWGKGENRGEVDAVIAAITGEEVGNYVFDK